MKLVSNVQKVCIFCSVKSVWTSIYIIRFRAYNQTWGFGLTDEGLSTR